MFSGKNINGLVQFKPVLFKSQLYLKMLEQETRIHQGNNGRKKKSYIHALVVCFSEMVYMGIQISINM